MNNPTGTTLNAVGADPAGLALQLKSSNNNGLGIEFAISTAGLEDLVLTFATSKLNNQGFDLNQVSYSTNGGSTFTDFGGTYNPSTVYAVETFDFSSIPALDNNSQVVIRIKFDGAQNNGGRNELDNVQLNATVIPEPGSIALLGAAALIGFRRRRRA
ncbi:MAG: PEP-CTERM sorting domain-containing protein [Planctomycetota bacterium]